MNAGLCRDSSCLRWGWPERRIARRCAGLPARAMSRQRGGERPRHGMLAFHVRPPAQLQRRPGPWRRPVSSWLATWGALAPALRPVWTMLHVAAVALGFWLLWRGRQPAWIEAFGERVTQQVSPSQPVLWMQPGGGARRARQAVCWVAWPCGLLQSALVVAALGSSAVDGAVLMGCLQRHRALACGSVRPCGRSWRDAPERAGLNPWPSGWRA